MGQPNSAGRQRALRGYWLVALATLVGIAVCAIPFLGSILGIIAGFSMITGNRQDKRRALLHQSEAPLDSIGQVQVGAAVRITGRVVSEAAITAPISGRRVVYAAVTGKASVRRGVNELRLPARHLGEWVDLEDATGRVRFELRHVHVLSRHVAGHVEHNQGRLPALRSLFRVPDDHSLEVEEMTLDADDQLWVAGRVAAIDEREGIRHVRLEASDQELRVTNLTPEELARMVATAPAYTVMGITWLLAATASAAYWIWRLLS